MPSVAKLEKDVAALPEADYREFRRWFLESDWDKWDHQLAADSAAGKLDFLVCEATASKGRKEF